MHICKYDTVSGMVQLLLLCVQGYYQEAGRAGRDGKPSDCILYYAARDIPRIHQMLRRGSRGRAKQARFQKGMELLDQVQQCMASEQFMQSGSV